MGTLDEGKKRWLSSIWGFIQLLSVCGVHHFANKELPYESITTGVLLGSGVNIDPTNGWGSLRFPVTAPKRGPSLNKSNSQVGVMLGFSGGCQRLELAVSF